MQQVACIEVENALGESILWNEDDQSAWWTDIEGKVLHRFDWRSQTLRRFATPERLSAFGFIAGEASLVCAFESGFALFDPETGLKSPIARPDGLMAGMRLNDGRVDRQGRFWAGAMVEDPASPRAARLYCLQDGSIQTRVDGLSISNGICWSPDSAWFYFADSGKCTIWRYSFDAATGAISDPHVFAQTTDGACPDGATVDAEGHIWSAQWGGGCIVRYAPDGRIDRVLKVPVSQPTCVAFGGPNLDLLFVTTARVGLNRDELGAQTGAGDVLVYNVQAQGLPENRFKMVGWPANRVTGG